ncbi:MAG: glutaredoxin family protein [Alkalispirochaeta sp.]
MTRKARFRGRGNPFPRAIITVVAAACVLAAGMESVYSQDTPTVALTYYGDISCDHCDVFVESYLPELRERYGVSFDVTLVDILKSAGEAEARALLADRGLEYRTFPVLQVGHNIYQGNYAIERHLPREIRFFLDHGRYRPFDRAASETRYHAGATGDEDAAAVGAPGEPGVLRFFWGIGCPHCEAAKPHLDRLEGEYPGITVERYEVYESAENRAIFAETREYYGSTSAGVPQFFFENHGWIGFSDGVIEQIESAIRGREPSRDIELPLFGIVDPETAPAFLVTTAIAFVDGFNPCSLWVLTLLLGLIAHTGSRRRVILVGGVFLVVTVLIYGAFMVGFLNVFAVVGHALAVRVVVAVVAVGMGLVNVKDYFAFKHGLSLTISPRFQRWIGVTSRDIAERDGTSLRLALITALFAGGVAIVELPCTAGFPMIWSRYVTSLEPSFAGYALLLGLYLFVYLILEMGIITVAAVSMHRIRFGVDQARVLKLAGGALMVSLGVFYLFRPDIAETIAGVGSIVGAAVLGTIALLIAGRIVSWSRRARPSGS